MDLHIALALLSFLQCILCALLHLRPEVAVRSRINITHAIASGDIPFRLWVRKTLVSYVGPFQQHHEQYSIYCSVTDPLLLAQ